MWALYIGASPNTTSLLEDIINHINHITDGAEYISKHKDGEKSFSRNRFFTIKVLLGFLMSNLQKAIQREISLFKDAIQLDGGSIPEVSKSAFCRARKKLKPSAFSALSDIVIDKFYASNEVKTWRSHRIIGVDGSIVEVPNSAEIQNEFGVFLRRDDGKAVCTAQMVVVYDTINHLTLQGSLASSKIPERNILMDLLPALQLTGNDILVMDRHYANHLLIFYLQKLGVQFCFRMRSDWKVVKSLMISNRSSDLVTLSLPKKDQSIAGELGIVCSSLNCRLLKIELETGETEILLTSLVNEDFSVDDMKELYNLRWPIEDLYKTFKHKMVIENFSGKSLKAILQDFFIKIFIMNLTAIAVRPINEALVKKTSTLKYTYQVNGIEAIATMKRAVISFFVTGKIYSGIKRLYDRLCKIKEPVRPGRKVKRKHLTKRKHHINYKPV